MNFATSSFFNLTRLGANRLPFEFAKRRIGTVCNQIVKVDSLCPVIDHARKWNPETLVCFDVDGTLVMSREKLAADIHFSSVRKLIEKGQRELGCHQDSSWTVDDYQSVIFQNAKNYVIDSRSVQLVQSLNARRVKTVALTALSRRRFGRIPDVLSWRINDLRSLGYDFDVGFDEDACFQFKDVVQEALPAFRKGILFSSTASKGRIVNVFLQRIQWRPLRVVLVDDSEEHIESFTSEMSRMGVDSTAFHYTEISKRNRELDPLITEFQIRHLLEKKRWIFDEQVARTS